jgi:hypothetical protein
VKILLAMSSPEYLRFYDDTVLELARRGHDVALAAGAVREGKPVRFDRIVQAHPRISVAGVIPERGDRWTTLARAVRGTMDFVRYLHPRLCEAPLLRARVKRQALPSALQWCDGTPSLDERRVTRWMTRLAGLERAIPPAPALVRFLEEHAPDVVLVSPLVEPGSDQVDLVRAAQVLGIRAGTLVASWDNLTNKGDLRVPTGLVAVWNEAQKREAVELHRVDPAVVAVTGAQPFDRWFDRQPSVSREAFCRKVGLPDERPFVLYTGSSIFISRAEVEMPFVKSWIAALRASSDPAVRGLAVLVRPHPYNGRAWTPEIFDGLDGVTVWPRGGYDPVDEENRAGLFDSLWHSAAVVGINTSAMIEAAIVGRPVFSIETAQFAGTQDGTLHYQHLLPEKGGFLRVATTLEAHVAQLAEALRNPGQVQQELTRFVHAFIRPQGLDVPSTPVLATAIERLGESPAPARVRPAMGSRLLRALLRPLTGSWAAPLLLAPSERKKHDRGRAPVPAPAGGRAVRVGRGVALAMAGAPVIALLLLGGFAVSETLGHTPLAYPRPANIAEAAGMGRGAEVLRFLQEGADPTVVLPVHPEIISSSITRATALEAAIWGRRVEMIRMLDRLGVIGPARAHMACLARDIRAADIAEYLGAESPDACEDGAAARLVRDRSR